MVTATQFRSLCLSLPGVEEKSHFGKADFRVANKIFAGLGEEPRQGYFKARAELREELLAMPGGAFWAARGAWGQHGWTYVELPAVGLSILRELIAESWRLVAPARLISGRDAGSGDTGSVDRVRGSPSQARRRRSAPPGSASRGTRGPARPRAARRVPKE